MAASEAPDPSTVRNLEEFITVLGELRQWAGGPSYRVLARRVGSLLRPPQVIAHTTVSDVFQPQRRRLDIDLVTAVVRALGVDEAEVARWRQTCVRVHVKAKADGTVGAFRQLPADLATFTGRDAELKQLLDIADAAHQGAKTVVISAINGMAGIGKTALAVQAGHLLAEQFPDGQLFVDLHAHSGGAGPRDPNEALGALLQALGLDARAIPSDLEERAKAFRSRLAGSRTLILLDDAANEQQIRPLFPADPGCLVLVTSRNRLKALDDAHPLPLDVLDPVEAIELLRRHVGPDRIAAADPALARIAELCGHLPLALRITAANLAHRPTWTTEYLETRLRSGLADLAAFDDGDRQVRAAFDLSHNNLTPDQQAAFRQFGLIPGPDGDVYAAAALLDTGVNQADALLQDLTDRSLLTETAPGRYRLHDLLREYARALATAHDSTEQRDTALDRLLHYYAHTAQMASVRIARWPRPALDSLAPPQAPDLTDPETARGWLRTEYPNLDAAYTHAHTHRLDRHATALAVGMAEILYSDGPWTRAMHVAEDTETVARRSEPAAHATILYDLGRLRCLTSDYPGATDAQTRALAIFRQLGHRSGEAASLNDLGRVRYLSADYPGAAEAQTQALEIFRQLGDRSGEAAALSDLSAVRYLTGDLTGGTDAGTRALEIYRQIGHRSGEATALTGLGWARYTNGDYPAAAEDLTQALEKYRQIRYRLGEINALNVLGQVHHATGDHSRAVDVLTQALDFSRQLGFRAGAAYALNVLGQVRYATGDYEGAADNQAQAVEICRDIGDRGGEAYALNFYAAAVFALGDHARALALYQQALAVNRELHKPDAEAMSLEGIAGHYLATGDTAQGIADLKQALEIYERLEMRADIERVRARLSELGVV